MNDDFEDRLTRTLARAADEAPVPASDPVDAVRRRQRRRQARRASGAAACAVAVVAVAVSVVAVGRPAVPEPGPQFGFSPDRVPNFANLSEPDKVWPDAVHRLPGRLPDGSRYAVSAVLRDGRYLVVRDGMRGDAAPSVFDTRAGTVTALGGSVVTDGVAPTLGVLMARKIGGQAVWFLEGSRDNQIGLEVWAAPLDGGPGRQLARLPDGSAPRFTVAADAIIWDQQSTGNSEAPLNSVRTVALSGGPARNVPGGQGFDLANVGPWIKNQHRGTGSDPRTAGELRNVVTGERLQWRANSGIQHIRCGPTWCVGDGSGGRVALQALDGSDPVELPYRGTLSPTDGGRLAVGQLELPNGFLQVIWDRTTGQAAGIKSPETADGLPSPRRAFLSPDPDPEVVTLSSTDDQLIVLDLTATK